MTVGMSSVLTDTDFGRRVMAAAGVQPCKFESWVIGPNGESFPDPAPGVPLREGYCREAREPEYHDPLTPEGFVGLWDALEARGWMVDFSRLLKGTLVQIFTRDERGFVNTATLHQAGGSTRAVALLEAAAQALVVPRG